MTLFHKFGDPFVRGDIASLEFAVPAVPRSLTESFFVLGSVPKYGFCVSFLFASAAAFCVGHGGKTTVPFFVAIVALAAHAMSGLCSC